MTQPGAPTEVRAFAALIPANTPQANPVTIPLAFPARVVQQIVGKIPSGFNGEVGFRIGSSGGVIIPANPGAWIIASDEQIEWNLANQITSGAWELTGYNTGRYDHTVYLRFLVVVPARPAMLDTSGAVIAQLSSPPSTPPTVANTPPIGTTLGDDQIVNTKQ